MSVYSTLQFNASYEKYLDKKDRYSRKSDEEKQIIENTYNKLYQLNSERDRLMTIINSLETSWITPFDIKIKNDTQRSSYISQLSDLDKRRKILQDILNY
jgi:uncharacterized protein YlxW (UPF0749 family)